MSAGTLAWAVSGVPCPGRCALLCSDVLRASLEARPGLIVQLRSHGSAASRLCYVLVGEFSMDAALDPSYDPSGRPVVQISADLWPADECQPVLSSGLVWTGGDLGTAIPGASALLQTIVRCMLLRQPAAIQSLMSAWSPRGDQTNLHLIAEDTSLVRFLIEGLMPAFQVVFADATQFLDECAAIHAMPKLAPAKGMSNIWCVVVPLVDGRSAVLPQTVFHGAAAAGRRVLVVEEAQLSDNPAGDDGTTGSNSSCRQVHACFRRLGRQDYLAIAQAVLPAAQQRADPALCQTLADRYGRSGVFSHFLAVLRSVAGGGYFPDDDLSPDISSGDDAVPWSSSSSSSSSSNRGAASGTARQPSSLSGGLQSVVGYRDLKRRLEVLFLRTSAASSAPISPLLRALFGAKLDSGIGLLLYGPSGCGKSFIAKSLAASLCYGVTVLHISGIYSPFVGESERRVREVFVQARKSAPSVILVDDLDVFAPRRGSSSMTGVDDGGVRDRVLSTLLNELDGISDRKTVMFVATSNHPSLIDDALLRPGRLDFKLLVPPPDAEDREAFFRKMLLGRCQGVTATEGRPSPADLQKTVEMLVQTSSGISCAALQRLEPIIHSLLLDRSGERSRLQEAVAAYCSNNRIPADDVARNAQFADAQTEDFASMVR